MKDLVLARRNHFRQATKIKKGKTVKVQNIFVLENASGKNEFYASFMYEGKSYQKKNLTKQFNATTLKQAEEKLEDIKSKLRNGIDLDRKSVV